jgi:hypothetical protein
VKKEPKEWYHTYDYHKMRLKKNDKELRHKALSKLIIEGIKNDNGETIRAILRNKINN